jgi:hypothetical protein
MVGIKRLLCLGCQGKQHKKSVWVFGKEIAGQIINCSLVGFSVKVGKELPHARRQSYLNIEPRNGKMLLCKGFIEGPL